MEAIDECCTGLDAALSAEDSGVDAYASGCTAILLFLGDFGVFIGSVGDSRAVLATTRDQPLSSKVDNSTSDGADVLPTSPLEAMQVTIDQKPTDPKEQARIQAAGGRVARMTDALGQRIGPHRVWKGNQNFPGLAMTRSIGDTVGNDIGIIPTPITSQIEDNAMNDQFYILASDGIWDVMSNEEAIAFVDRHRRICPRKDSYSPGQVASVQNCNIAHLLSQEARKRWLRLVEEEDVLIDDISAIVIELKIATDIRASLNVPTPNPSVDTSGRNRSISEADPNPKQPVQVAGNRYAKRQSIFREEDENATK